jgi:hypothetical protein
MSVTRPSASGWPRVPEQARVAMSLAALVLAVGTLALIAYVLLLIVGLSVVGAILEALSSLDGDLDPWGVVLRALPALVAGWVTGLGLASLAGGLWRGHDGATGILCGLSGRGCRRSGPAVDGFALG